LRQPSPENKKLLHVISARYGGAFNLIGGRRSIPDEFTMICFISLMARFCLLRPLVGQPHLLLGEPRLLLRRGDLLLGQVDLFLGQGDSHLSQLDQPGSGLLV
jgi:hypothetical protein